MARQFLPDLFGRSSGNDVFSNLHREVDRVFSDFGCGMPALSDFGRLGGMALKANICETENAIEVTAEIPGVKPEEFYVQLKDGRLTIKGEKKEEKYNKQKYYHIVERSYGMFERSFTLPGDVDAEKVEASFDKGVLTVTLPKLPEAKSKAQKIAVKSAA